MTSSLQCRWYRKHDCRRTAAMLLIGAVLSSFATAGTAELRLSGEHEVKLAGPDGVELAGALLLPPSSGDAKLPGVIMVAGSGPTDRNGSAPGITIDLLKQIAEALAEEGIASLRYDRRGIGASGQPDANDSLSDFVRWENFVGDAAAAFSYLQQRPEIDADRCGMLGHSEGGMLILQAAVEGKDLQPPPAALVLAGTPGRRGDVVVRQQIGRDPLSAALLSKPNDEIMAAIIETGEIPDDVPPLLAPLYPAYLGQYWQSVLKFEGAEWAARYPGPVLVIAGEFDLNHEVKIETAALSAALRTRNPDEHEVFIVPGASHNLKPVKARMEPGFEGDVVPEALEKLREWVAKVLR